MHRAIPSRGPRIRSGLIVVSLLVGIAACGSDDTSSSTAAGGGRLETMLAAVPASAADGEYMVYVLGDIDAVEELAAEPRPDRATASNDDIFGWLVELGQGESVRVLVPFREIGPYANETAAIVGWSLVDLHRFAFAMSGGLSVVDTGTTAEALDSAVGPATDGVWGVGGESEMFAVDANYPELTHAWMGLKDGLLALGGNAADVQEFLADGPTLTDSPGYLAVVQALDRAGVYAGAVAKPVPFSTESYRRSNPRATDAKVQTWAEAQSVPQQFDALGVGSAVVDGEPVTVFVYHHADGAAAAANAPVIESLFRTGTSVKGARAFSDMLPLQSVVTEGELVIVTVTGVIDWLPLLMNVETVMTWQ